MNAVLRTAFDSGKKIKLMYMWILVFTLLLGLGMIKQIDLMALLRERENIKDFL